MVFDLIEYLRGTALQVEMEFAGIIGCVFGDTDTKERQWIRRKISCDKIANLLCKGIL